MSKIEQVVFTRKSWTVDEGTMGFTDYVTKDEPMEVFINRVTEGANALEQEGDYKVKQIAYPDEHMAVLVCRKRKTREE